MKLSRLKLSNVRNHLILDYNIFDETIFIGINGSGKSSILEAIYLLLSMRGFKRQPLSSLISFGEKFLRIDGNFICQSTDEKDIVLTYSGKKDLLVDNAKINNYNEFLYSNLVMVYTPDHTGILSSSYIDRRSYIDRSIFYTDISYITLLRSLNRLLDQKTSELIKDRSDKLYIDILNEKLLPLSEDIYKKRLDLVNSINEKLKNYYDTIFKDIDKYYLSYESNVLDTSLLSREFNQKRLIYGTHRDRFSMVLEDRNMEKYSSFGQRKSFSLLVMLSILENIESYRSESIICLLDDFEAGLDIKRCNILKELLSVNRQSIYTGIDANRVSFKNIIDIDKK